MVEASGHRRNGETFFGQAWVSSYSAASGPCLAVILLDVTEQVRDREEGGLKQLLSNSRIVAGAVSHELRNLAAAASVLHHNLTKTQHGLNDNADFRALGTVVDSALKLASTELSDTMEDVLEGLNVGELLEELRAIVSPGLEEAGIQGEWEIQQGLPGVRVDRSGLLQVFLNLAKNSMSALRGRPEARLRITAYGLEGTVVIRRFRQRSGHRRGGPAVPAVSARGFLHRSGPVRIARHYPNLWRRAASDPADGRVLLHRGTSRRAGQSVRAEP